MLMLGLCLLCFSLKGQTQAADKLRQPIPGLPFAALEDSGFNKDSIENLLRYINDTPPRDFRG